MSWSFGIPAGPVSVFRSTAEAAAKTYLEAYTASDEEKAAMVESIASSISTAGLLALIVQPEANGWVSGYLSGHANPGHRKRGPYANDFITVTVSQVEGS